MVAGLKTHLVIDLVVEPVDPEGLSRNGSASLVVYKPPCHPRPPMDAIATRAGCERD
jgi:hypothetical protein